MPQASEALREEWGVDPMTAQQFLTDAGYKLTRQYVWILPLGQEKPDAKQERALTFLFDEWDYGGWVPHPGPAGLPADAIGVQS